MKKKAVLSIGSNLGNRYAVLKLAIKEIEARFSSSCLVSRFYLTPPWGNENQSSFINAAVLFETSRTLSEALATLQDIEIALGRRKTEKWGPRVIDIDILFWGDDVVQNEQINVPHKHLAERDFVLKPLMDLIPKYKHPVSKLSVNQLYAQITDKTSTFSST